MTVGQWFGIKFRATKGFVVSSVIIIVLFALAGRLMFSLPWGTALLAGVMLTVLYWLSDLAHQLGHAWVASRIGYPMSLLQLHWFLIASAYPIDEPPLPAGIHIRRALGGFPVSFFLALLGMALLLFFRLETRLVYYLLLAFSLINFLIFGLGSILPLGFTDGSTLIIWLPRRGE